MKPSVVYIDMNDRMGRMLAFVLNHDTKQVKGGYIFDPKDFPTEHPTHIMPKGELYETFDNYFHFTK